MAKKNQFSVPTSPEPRTYYPSHPLGGNRGVGRSYSQEHAPIVKPDVETLDNYATDLHDVHIDHQNYISNRGRRK